MSDDQESPGIPTDFVVDRGNDAEPQKEELNLGEKLLTLRAESDAKQTPLRPLDRAVSLVESPQVGRNDVARRAEDSRHAEIAGLAGRPRRACRRDRPQG